MAQNVERARQALGQPALALSVRDDAKTWLAIYRKLIVVTESMLERSRLYRAGLRPTARRQAASVDIRLIEEELGHLRDRGRWWADRIDTQPSTL